IKILYYISPQVWAWRSGRVRKMKGLIDKMLVVFPFEVEIYKDAGIDVEFVGHPLLDVLKEPQGRTEFFKRYGFEQNRPLVGLFPGSRNQEIERIFPLMIGAAKILYKQFNIQVAVGVSSLLGIDYIRSFLRDDFPVQLIQNATYDVMKNTDVAMVTSGTATLETGYYQTPMVIIYKTSLLTYLVGRLLVNIKNIGLVNILAGRQIVPELIQSRAHPVRLAKEVEKMLCDDALRQNISNDLAIIKDRLGTFGASVRVADTVLSMV
ncbi:MAG TPA: lipid-A-disaccharide synthase, partial [Bacteroidota bacterium]|nr:lipid-A-disaccharide synthase [Bacteroidota bacterium]